ncbi:hypothetical protein BDV93DRAFT_514308 [Ceratobasidium sp. AG-I]|nr:hypothetical protein BDV93DRAFT_514308 [Ceratobasidium sp. AG-I]
MSSHVCNSVFSDMESTGGAGETGECCRFSKTFSLFEAVGQHEKAVEREVPKVLENLIEFDDGDACILAQGMVLATYKYLLKRFTGLKGRIVDRILVLGPEDHGIEEFRNTFKILYASVIEEAPEFDTITLTSALCLATTYDYPALRVFSIKHLENASLSAVERIRLAREFDLPSWEEPAYVELCERDEAVTVSEAAVLGLDASVHVASIREREQRRRGREVDAATDGNRREIRLEEQGKIEQGGRVCPVNGAGSRGDPAENTSQVVLVPDLIIGVGQLEQPQPEREMQQEEEEEGEEYGEEEEEVKAFKDIQMQQRVQKKSLSKLETAMTIMQDAARSAKDSVGSHTKSELHRLIEVGPIQEEVRKWLRRSKCEDTSDYRSN